MDRVRLARTVREAGRGDAGGGDDHACGLRGEHASGPGGK